MISDESDKKVQLLEKTYSEVLDATKHQDDKVGRLLTAASFFIAGSLALAKIGDKELSAHFKYSQYELPRLVEFSLYLFLLLITLAVLALLYSVSTPLRNPVLRRTETDTGTPDPASSEGRNNSDSNDKGKRAGSDEKPPSISQLYFYSIAESSIDEWRDKWNLSFHRLQEERLEIYIRETHNLAVRADRKYQRTNKAVSLMSLSLLAFLLTAILGIRASVAPSSSVKAVEIGAGVFYGASITIAAWVYITLRTQDRHRTTNRSGRLVQQGFRFNFFARPQPEVVATCAALLMISPCDSRVFQIFLILAWTAWLFIPSFPPGKSIRRKRLERIVVEIVLAVAFFYSLWIEFQPRCLGGNPLLPTKIRGAESGLLIPVALTAISLANSAIQGWKIRALINRRANGYSRPRT